MKQENLDELKNIYLGLVTGGEGPELLSEAPKVTVVDPNFERKAIGKAIGNELKYMQTDAFKRSFRAGTPGNTSEKPVQNPVKAAVPVKPEPYKSKFAGARDAAFEKAKQIKGSPVVGSKPSNNTGNNGGLGSGGGTTTPTAPRPAATTAPKPAASPTKPMGGAPMDQWARANPTLAAKVKPGQSGYDTIKTRLSADNDRGPSTPTPPTPPTPAAAEPSGETDRLKKALDIKKSDVTSSYQFPMYKTLRDLSDSYNEIYEAKKKLDLVGQEDDDIDNDGDTDKSDKYLLNRRKVRSKAIGEATAMSKRGLDEPAIRNQIASKTRGGSFADKATALADKETYGDKKKKEGREKFARKQRGDFRDTTSSSPGLRGYGYKSDDPEVKAKQAARGAQRGSAALTPNERKQLNMEYDLYDLIQSHLLEYGFADTEEGANMIIENMSPSWIKQILSED